MTDTCGQLKAPAAAQHPALQTLNVRTHNSLIRSTYLPSMCANLSALANLLVNLDLPLPPIPKGPVHYTVPYFTSQIPSKSATFSLPG